MQLWAAWIVIAAVVAPHLVASTDVSCDCRLWHRRDTSVAIHCAKDKEGTSQVSCKTALVPDVPPGYEYVPGYGLLKLYRVFKTWWAAKKACENQGSRLAIPPDREAYKALSQIFEKEESLYWAFIGISYEPKRADFIGVDGRPVTFLPWQSNRPNVGSNVICINTHRDGMISELGCDWQSPFFCERILSVGVPDTYRWLEDAGRFYKVHQEKRKHAEAAETCRSENGTLAVTDTWRRGEALLNNLLEPQNDLYHIGFTDQAVEGDFVTDTGRHLNDMDFREWGYKEPNNGGANADEDCLALSGEGYYNDVECDRPLGFICEIIPM